MMRQKLVAPTRVAAACVAIAAAVAIVIVIVARTDAPPRARASVAVTGILRTSAGGLKPAHIQLTWVGKELREPVVATTLINFADSNRQVAVVVLVQGNVAFLGDPDPRPTPDERNPTPIKGNFHEVRKALDAIAAAPWPRRTRAAVVTYAQNAEVKLPLNHIRQLTPSRDAERCLRPAPSRPRQRQRVLGR